VSLIPENFALIDSFLLTTAETGKGHERKLATLT
jgi:hypothetical protein